MTLPRAAEAPAAPRRALVVEDDPDLRQLLRTHLRHLGWEVRVVATGEEALAEALARPPALVVVDVLLPGIDGRAVVRALRRSPETRRCRVVATTVLEPEELGGLSLDGVLPKPFSRADVRRVLAGVDPAPAPAPAPAPDPVLPPASPDPQQEH